MRNAIEPRRIEYCGRRLARKRGSTLLNIEKLLEEAKASKHGEAYETLTRSLSYRIGVGVRRRSQEDYVFFVEVLVYLCPASSSLDLETLERSIICLKELEKRGYSLACQDRELVSCETIVPAESLAEEYSTVKPLVEEAFNTQNTSGVSKNT